jgi:hypothetical protein
MFASIAEPFAVAWFSFLMGALICTILERTLAVEEQSWASRVRGFLFSYQLSQSLTHGDSPAAGGVIQG